jgi:hypothetical protein
MGSRVSIKELNDFIVRAKSVSYVGGGSQTDSCRPGSHDLKFQQGEFAYLDSYFGGTDFIGQEVVYFRDEPVWAIIYYGKILAPGKITGAENRADYPRQPVKNVQGRALPGRVQPLG